MAGPQPNDAVVKPASKPASSGKPNFTNIDRSKATRVVPMEVLVLGMPKTGTSSVKQALHELGYNDVYHMQSIARENPRDAILWKKAYEAKYEGKGTWGKKDWDALLGHCMVASDLPPISFTYDLLEAYPDAKVVLTVRDIDSWAASYQDTIMDQLQHVYRTYVDPWSIQAWLRPKDPVSDLMACMLKYEPDRWSRYNAKEAYTDQSARVRNLVPKEKLLEFDVRQGWEPLCTFLDKEVPKDKDFPRVMDRAMFKMMVENARFGDSVNMAINMATKLGVVGVFGGLVWLARKRVLF